MVNKVETWTLCDDKMPEDLLRKSKNIRVLATKYDGTVSSVTRKRDEYSKEYYWTRDCHVIAWKSLPEPYDVSDIVKKIKQERIERIEKIDRLIEQSRNYCQ